MANFSFKNAAHQIFSFVFGRIFLVSVLLLLQVIFFVSIFNQLFDYSLSFYIIGYIFSLFTVIFLVSTRENPTYKLVWAIFMLAISPIGAVTYWFFGWQRMPSRKIRRIHKLDVKSSDLLPPAGQIIAKLQTDNPEIADQSHYLQHYAHFPLYDHTQTRYFSPGEAFFLELKRQLKSAEKFIFLEYFIINEESSMWQEILHILCTKIEAGVEVRLIYDDFGSLFTVPSNFAKRMKQLGIDTVSFNRFRPFIEVRMNNRDHRKIAIIDGRVAFTGGINFSDEYINRLKLHGYWKDSAIMLEGEAVWSFTVMFLQFWNFITPTDSNYDQYKGKFRLLPETDGFVQPFADSPQDNELVSHHAYLNLINRAEKEIIITTPYLIIDQELMTALCLAAKNGLDVKIIVPGIADRWYSHLVSQAFYLELMEAGVQIWEYEPGFIHSKTILVDGQVGIVGSINLDYRSLYLNFEAGVWLYQSQALAQLKTDLKHTLAVCAKVRLSEVTEIHLFKRLLRGVLRLFAPLM